MNVGVQRTFLHCQFVTYPVAEQDYVRGCSNEHNKHLGMHPLNALNTSMLATQ